MTQNDQIRAYIFGIDRDTFEIRSATITQGGNLSISSNHNPIGQSSYIGNADPVSEVTIRYGLLDAYEIGVNMLDTKIAEQMKEDLQSKANERKAAAAATPPKTT